MTYTGSNLTGDITQIPCAGQRFRLWLATRIGHLEMTMIGDGIYKPNNYYFLVALPKEGKGD